MRIVVALGGNALVPEHERGTWDEQLAHALPAARAAAELHRAGHEVLLTHGNGPQVGALALQQAAGEPDEPAMPFDVLAAMTQGQVGYLLQLTLWTVDPTLPTAVVLTRVRVDRDDPSFALPTKPIGPFYAEAEALTLAAERGWRVGPDAGRGWRRVMPSPRPLEILELAQIRALLERGALVVALGGGGIPVALDGGRPQGIEAVIDKDRASAELACALGADLLVMLTGVARVALDYGTRWQRDLARLTVSDARRHLAAGDFPAGSMGPKIESAARFAAGGRAAVVTSVERAVDAVAGRDGTWIVADASGPSRVASAGLTAMRT
jgi:carbamate kinase